MTLLQYLRRRTLKVTEFNKKLAEFGVKVTDISVGRYCNGHRIPSPEIMEAIRKATNGAVQLRDWIGVRKDAA